LGCSNPFTKKKKEEQRTKS